MRAKLRRSIAQGRVAGTLRLLSRRLTTALAALEREA
jgi:hypothetical protein